MMPMTPSASRSMTFAIAAVLSAYPAATRYHVIACCIGSRHEQAGDAHAPGFYLHLEPGGSGAAAGMWKPGRDELAKVRGAIAASPSKWRDSTSGGEFKRRWEVTGESLVRAPRGFDPEHPAIDEIKRKDFIAWSHFTDEEICSPNFIDEYTDACYGVSPMVEYLSETIGLSF